MPTNEETIELPGQVIQLLPGALYRVQLPNGHVLLAHLGRQQRQELSSLAEGDQVRLEVSPYDLGKARITGRPA